ncbi:MAG: hypothetical protein EBS48_05175 [Actinobacteria bacterium]|nr:hypothetical protein [Actinomycetota bacterium]
MPEVDESTGEVLAEANTEEVSATMTDALSVAAWHRGRDNGQKYRFRKLEACGSRIMVAQCRACDTARKGVPEGCGIARLCSRCSLLAAKARRARFGRARQRAETQLRRVGKVRARRRQARPCEGLWSDKMITLTVPHFLLSHVEPGAPLLDLDGRAKAPARDSTMARIYAVRAAWPLFARGLRKFFKLGGTLERPRHAWVTRPPIGVPQPDGTYEPPPMHRAFEWTPGGDALGHPHFHVWILAPHIPATVIAQLWRDALRAVGVPLEADAYVRVQIKAFRDFDRNAVGELIKAGDRRALEWSRLYKHGPANAFEYADGWTIADALREARPDVIASLYMALEGARLTQASRGFFLEDEPAACPCCGARSSETQSAWLISFQANPDHQQQGRAPP